MKNFTRLILFPYYKDYLAQLSVFVLLVTIGILFPYNLLAQTPPTGYSITPVASGWNQAVGLTFSTDGRMFVWEKGGKVWVVKNGVKDSAPMIDISPEVGNWKDYGLIGFALDPKFETNGHVYLLYIVDRHHLLNFGTASYNPASNAYNNATIGRLTRYTATDMDGDGYPSVDLNSRKILIGETKSTGFPIVYTTHGVGSLVFGTDGTLLVSCGDAASYSSTDLGSASETYYARALLDGIITEKENVGSFRSQLLSSLNGKILRLDPETGDGIPSNPYYNAANPRSAQSRVWALGLRNPYRMSLKPETGSHVASDGNPGVLYLGDVGWNGWEELNIVTGPGMNFGWPIYEGLQPAPAYANADSILNLDAPNPLYGNGASCVKPYFSFTDLLKQATEDGNASFPNPCNPNEQIPATYNSVVYHKFVHARPSIDWKHGSTPVARTGNFTNGQASVVGIGATGSPVLGSQFSGNCAIGGIWYTGNNFPPEYKNTYFLGDYGKAWIKTLQFDEQDKPIKINNFIGSGAIVLAMAMSPIDGALYYVHLGGDPLVQEVRKISFSGNKPPVAIASSDKTYGSGPLAVQFTVNTSTDPEGGMLTYEWNFGDGSPVSTVANPLHTFTATAGAILLRNVILKVTDSLGLSATTKIIISINNTPPVVKITSPVNNSVYPLNAETVADLIATVSDSEQSGNGLSYSWQTILHHNNHIHVEPTDTNRITTADIAPVGCDGETYYYTISLTVTDAAGLSATDEVAIYPDCNSTLNVTGLSASAGDTQVTLNWTKPSQSFDEIMVVAKPASAIVANPEGDGSAYTADASFTGVGSSFDGSGKVVYKGTGTQQIITNLVNGTTYYFKVFARIGSTWSGGVAANAIPSCPIPTVQASNVTFTNVTSTSMKLDWTNGNGSGRIVKINTSNVFTDPVDGVSPIADNVYGRIGEQVVANGVNPSVTVTGLVAGTKYYFRVYEYNCTNAAIKYLKVVSSNNSVSQTTSKIAPIITWNNPADIVYGTALSSTQLNASSNVPGAFSYTPAAGTVLNVGLNQSLSAVFTPGDTVMYSKVQNVTVKINVTNASSTCSATGSILRELWTGVSGRSIADIPLNLAPSSISQLTSFEGPTNSGDNYGARVRGYVCVPQTGNYKFWIAGDDNCELWLSTDDKPTNASKIAYVSGLASNIGYTQSREWTKYTTQQSAPIELIAGKTYYIEALHKEAGSSDNLAIGWQLPDGTLERPIAGNRLSPFVPGNYAPRVNISLPANNAVIQAGATITINASVKDIDGTISKVEFFQNGIKLGQILKAPFSYSWSNAPAGSYTLTLIATDNAGASSISNPISVTVNGNNQAPSVSITSPIANASFAAGSSVTIDAVASDADGSISKVEFFQNGAKLGEDLQSPFTITWVNVAPGNYNVTAIASDNLGLTATSAQVPVIVSKIIPVVSWSIPADITYGAYLSDTQLNASASTTGTFSYSPSIGTLLNAGSNQVLSVTFTPADPTMYESAVASVQINVNKASPTLNWSKPTAIVSGTPLGSTQLNASSTVAGSFTYSPADGTLLPIGNNQLLQVNFIPTDQSNYTSANASVLIDVNACTAAGYIVREYWDNVTGNAVSLIPTTISPTSISQLTTFETPVNVANNYGVRIRGYICAPKAGTYTFWIAGDDNCELWLSTDDQSTNKRLIANVPGATSRVQWGKYTQQKSVPITLQIGQRYYIEALQKEGLSNDHVEVGWTLPGATSPIVIPGSALSPFTPINSRVDIDVQNESATKKLSASPNPFSDKLNISFVASETGNVRIDIFDITGLPVKHLYEANVVAGEKHTTELVGNELKEGVYILRLTSVTNSVNLKVVLVR